MKFKINYQNIRKLNISNNNIKSNINKLNNYLSLFTLLLVIFFNENYPNILSK